MINENISFSDEVVLSALHEKNRIDLPSAQVKDNPEQMETNLILTYDNPLWRDLMYIQLYRQAQALDFSAGGVDYAVLEVKRPTEEQAADSQLVAVCHVIHEYFAQVEFDLKLDYLPVRDVYDQTKKELVDDALIAKESIYRLMRYKRRIKRDKQMLAIHFKAYRAGRLLESVKDMRCQYDDKLEFNEYSTRLLANQPDFLMKLSAKHEDE